MDICLSKNYYPTPKFIVKSPINEKPNIKLDLIIKEQHKLISELNKKEEPKIKMDFNMKEELEIKLEPDTKESEIISDISIKEKARIDSELALKEDSEICVIDLFSNDITVFTINHYNPPNNYVNPRKRDVFHPYNYVNRRKRGPMMIEINDEDGTYIHNQMNDYEMQNSNNVNKADLGGVDKSVASKSNSTEFDIQINYDQERIIEVPQPILGTSTNEFKVSLGSKRERKPRFIKYRKGLKCCSFCKFKTYSKKLFLTHVYAHFNIKFYACSKCGDEFTNENKFIKHSIKHFERSLFVCSECDYQGQYKADNINHMLKHANVPLLICLVCNYEGKHLLDLISHMLIHSKCV